MATTRPLKLLCWEGYERAEFTHEFSQRTGVEIDGDTLLSDASAAAQVLNQPGAYDVLNINNAYVRNVLHPAGTIEHLDESRFETYLEGQTPSFDALARWTRSADDAHLIGVGQRFGPFNLVINSSLVSRHRAQDEGFALAEDASLPYGVLRYDDFNIFHIAIAAGLNPFQPLSAGEVDVFERKAAQWFDNATLVTDDHHVLNQALVCREIACYLSGGIYTASPARLDGRLEIEAITPNRGPIDGLGGIVFAEITSVLKHDDMHPMGVDFLTYLLEPASAVKIAMIDGTCNPVVQMGNPNVFNAFSARQLAAIQWDTLAEDVSRCVHYDTVPNHAQLLESLHHVS
jgi:spermidine/putrescine transport system substrate-binding protein